MINTHKIGIVSKEAIVSAGHIVNKIAKKHKTQIIPLDSEHFSIYQNFNKMNLQNKKILITGATGGIGNSLVEKFYDSAAIIVATGTNKEKLDNLW